MSAASVEATLGRPLDPGHGPRPARLLRARRAWNVSGHTSLRPDYEFHRPDGTPWQGWITFLGLEDDAATSTLGAVVAVADDDLVRLDARESGYARIDVGDRIATLDGGSVDGPVDAYWPRPEVLAEAARPGIERTVMARYLRLVDDAYRRLGDDLYQEHLATMPEPRGCRVEEILARPVDPVTTAGAVDPAPTVSTSRSAQ